MMSDKFHVAMHLNKAVDLVRRAENRELLSKGVGLLKGTKYDGLRNSASFSRSAWKILGALRDTKLKVARAWTDQGSGHDDAESMGENPNIL